MTQIETLLQSVPSDDWVTKQAVIFDWCDGPREGVAILENPPCEFAFRLFAARYNRDDADDRLFRLAQLPAGSVMNILGAMLPLGEPVNRVWVPVWRFATEAEKDRADRDIDRILMRRRDTSVVVYTRDMVHFLGCWQIDREVTRPADWFAELGV